MKCSRLLGRSQLRTIWLPVWLVLTGCADSLQESRAPDAWSFTGEPQVEGGCVAAADKLMECGALVSMHHEEWCTPAVAADILASPCADIPAALQTDDHRDESEITLKSDGPRRRGNLACRMGFMTACPVEVCLDDEAVEPPDDDQGCIEWARYEGCKACEYYRCRERTAQCGPDGYLLGYVGKYCDRFSTVTETRLSDAGAQWMRGVRRCLVDVLDSQTGADDSCETIEQVGIDSHAECYVGAGFCQLSLTDWFAIIHTIDAFDIPFRQIVTTGNLCFKEWFGGDK